MAADFVPDEMYVLLHHDGQVGRFPDFEEVQWTKMDDEYYTDEPGPSFFYNRQGGDESDLPVPSEDAWLKFLARIEEIGVFSWENGQEEVKGRRMGYEPPVWVFELSRPGMDSFRRKGPIEKLPPNFDKFCEALSELMGGQRFGEE